MRLNNYFPRVDVVASSQFATLLTEAANSLGVQINHLDPNLANSELCKVAKGSSVVTFINVPANTVLVNLFERELIRCAPSSKLINTISEQSSRFNLSSSGNGIKLQVIVARSPHGQIASWTPFSISEDSAEQLIVVPAPGISESDLELAQNYAIQIAGEIGLIGVLNVGIEILESHPTLIDIHYGPSRLGLWTLNGSITSQFEQHLRAILDLPLGDTSLKAKWTVTGDIKVGRKQDMYRPYLHLMARTPEMKFWQGSNDGFLSIQGDELSYLKGEIEHALLYFKGEIDE
jgi:phosphoribosylaminoimidazole carboxylase (NCAIR synthetase)